jgi:hypothetical protein
VHDTDDAEHAAHLVRARRWPRALHALATKPVLHGDNGATLKATTVLAMLHWLGVKPSYSRPRVSDDNAYAEALFRTAKYRPSSRPRASPIWTPRAPGRRQFVRWYNVEHRHSGIRYVSPAQRHAGEDHAILAARHALYTEARATPPGALVRPHPQLVAHRRGDAQPRARLGHQDMTSRHQIDSLWLHDSGDNYLDARRSPGRCVCAEHQAPSWAPHPRQSAC